MENITTQLDPIINKPGHGGNTISIDVAQTSDGAIECVSRSYSTNADFTERPGAAIEYNINFGSNLSSESVLPDWYIPALFLESSGAQRIDTRIKSTGDSVIEVDMVPIKHNYVNTIFGDSQLNTLSDGTKALRTYLSFNYNNAYEKAIGFVYGSNQVQDDGSAMVYYRADGTTTTTAVTLGNRYKFRVDKNDLFINGDPAKRYRFGPFVYEEFESAYSLMLFGGRHQPNGYSYSNMRVYEFSLANGIPASNGKTDTCHFIPALDPVGAPCMYDRITKKPFYNSGSGAFIVGLTVKQARALWQLSSDATKKTLTVSLPASIVDGETVTDTDVRTALYAAASNGWIITIQTYTD